MRISLVDEFERHGLANLEKAGNILGYFPLGTGRIRAGFGGSQVIWGVAIAGVSLVALAFCRPKDSYFWHDKVIRGRSYMKNGIANIIRGGMEEATSGGKVVKVAICLIWDLSGNRVKYLGEMRMPNIVKRAPRRFHRQPHHCHCCRRINRAAHRHHI